MTACVKEQTDNVSSLGLGYFLQMTKPTISLLVVVTALPGLLLASDDFPSLSLLAATLGGTWFASASAGVFNQLIDLQIDTRMDRTRSRPLPAGRISMTSAVLFGLTLGLSGLVVLYFFTTPLAALLALGANLFYVAVYTVYLKPRTVQNIVIGGAAGAVGPLIGWAAVTNSLAPIAWLLFALIFLWTPPHFWALALKYKDDYAQAGVPMLPVVRGDRVTRQQIFFYTLTLFPVVAWLYWLGAVGLIGFAVCLGLTAIFGFRAYQLYRENSNDRAMTVFGYSCLYLLAVFLVISFDRILVVLS